METSERDDQAGPVEARLQVPSSEWLKVRRSTDLVLR